MNPRSQTARARSDLGTRESEAARDDRSPARPDGFAKASGSLAYADDARLEGMLFGATLRSPHPHARIRSAHWRPERAPAGAIGLLARDLTGPNGVQLLDDAWPILAGDGVHHVGEAVGLAAATSPEAAQAALAAFEIEYEPLPARTTPAEALPSDVFTELEILHGDVAHGFTQAAHIVEGTWRTARQEHVYIECQSMTAWIDTDDTLVVQGSMQCPYYVQNALSHALKRPAQRVRVVATPPGGGFGGKEDYPSLLALHVALLALATRHPVRISYDRHEDMLATSKRHPSEVHHRSGVDSDGRLTAMDVDILLDAGAYRTLSPVVLSRAVLHATGAYRCPNVRIRGRAVRTHTLPNGAFRGFGAPQVLFAVERQMDRIARAVGIDPLEIRLRNVLEPGDELPTGQVLDDSTSARLCLERVERETDFRRRWREHERQRSTISGDANGSRKGVGISLYLHGSGFTGNGEKRLASTVRARLRSDGRIELQTASVDMGQGSCIVLPMVAADACGLHVDDFVVAEPDTSRVPDSGPTVASRTSMIVAGEVALAAQEICGQIVDAWGKRIDSAEEARLEAGELLAGSRSEAFRQVARCHYLEYGASEVTRVHTPPAWQEFDEESYRGVAYPTYAFGADVAEVEVDPDTLQVRPLAVTAVCEVGRVLHPVLCRGQIEGGTLQAVGWALMEEAQCREGHLVNDRLATYLLPTVQDCPEIQVVLLEHPWNGVGTGAKGVGELPMNGAAPAVVAAIENATGLAIAELPATPERLLVELERQGLADRTQPS